MFYVCYESEVPISFCFLALFIIQKMSYVQSIEELQNQTRVVLVWKSKKTQNTYVMIKQVKKKKGKLTKWPLK